MDEIRQNESIQIGLESNIKTLVIDGIRFEMNLDSVDTYKALSEFKEQFGYIAGAENVDDVLEKCEKVINTVLGDTACDRLFNEKSMKMYLLVNELANIFLENFMKEEREKEEERTKKELENLNQLFDGMNNLAKTLAYADNRYGNRGMNSYVRNGKPSKKHKNKKH